MPVASIQVIEFFHRVRIKMYREIQSLLGDRVSIKWDSWEEIDSHFSRLSQQDKISRFRRSGLVLETMDYQGSDARPFSKELARIGVIENPLGRPLKPLTYVNSLNLGRQYQHLNMWSSQPHHRLQKVKRIVEFGGGFGMMCWLVYQLGYTGTYFIVDNKGTTSLQKNYLKSTLTNEQYSKVEWCANLGALSPQLKKEDLFIALWSTSETPDHVLNSTLQELEMVAPQLLLAFQDSFKGRDNLNIFRQYELIGNYSMIEKWRSHYVTS
jgi:hypothetical protein